MIELALLELCTSTFCQTLAKEHQWHQGPQNNREEKHVFMAQQSPKPSVIFALLPMAMKHEYAGHYDTYGGISNQSIQHIDKIEEAPIRLNPENTLRARPTTVKADPLGLRVPLTP